MFRDEFVRRSKWLTDEAFLDLLGATKAPGLWMTNNGGLMAFMGGLVGHMLWYRDRPNVRGALAYSFLPPAYSLPMLRLYATPNSWKHLYDCLKDPSLPLTSSR